MLFPHRLFRWLTYHDKETGNLPGMLPLAIGMRVAFTDTIDKSKQLLRGTVGIVHSWDWLPGNLRPSIVYIKIEDADWQLDGISEPGVYPIVPRSSDWYLDKGRKVKMLKVKRTQLPLVPAYAMTAHSSQGKTLRAVLLDLQVDKKVDPTIGTVAATRVRSREDVLIMRPFAKFLFQRGLASEGPDLLLKKLRGEEVNWEAVREARRPCAPCQNCSLILPMDAFEQKQWEQVRANKTAMCKACKEGRIPKRRRKLDAESLQKHLCLGCNTNKIAEAFPRAQLVQENAETLRRCLKCVQSQHTRMLCCRCSETKAQPDFEPEMVTMPMSGVVCRACQEEVRQQKHKQKKGFFSCRTCAKVFSTSLAIGKDQGRRCLNCSSRDTWKKGESTCRSCKRKWVEDGRPCEDGKRQRCCPQCRQI